MKLDDLDDFEKFPGNRQALELGLPMIYTLGLEEAQTIMERIVAAAERRYNFNHPRPSSFSVKTRPKFHMENNLTQNETIYWNALGDYISDLRIERAHQDIATLATRFKI